ncbi:MAG: hypothetical protein LBR28_05030 [Bacteroidales bacterium]|jgi:hypothetical protein|nr:hypothetical protein [Bacteroidales bacterium]
MIVETIIISIGGVFVMGIAGYYFLKLTRKFINNENRITLLELKKAKQTEISKVIIPVKLQAYERLMMFLERIKPENLVMRLYQYGMETPLLKDVMLKNIRDEFEYNLSQQLYVSEQSWILVIKAKEETIALINSVASSNDLKTMPPASFSGIIFETMTKSLSPIENAQKVLKQELEYMK